MNIMTHKYIIFAGLTIVGLSFFTADTTRALATQIATGESTACAVSDGKVKCWGVNSQGQLGTGEKSAKETKPVDPIGGLLANKFVDKVSVGNSHVCALADARAYCWGDNSYGQLGNETTTDALTPVAVYAKRAYTEIIPAHCNGNRNPITGCGFPSGTWVSEKRNSHPTSALVNKEIIDISAAEDFTCALASDGTVACWGEGDNGRLGTNTTDDVDYPRPVYTAGALSGKKGIRLAKASGSTMCVLAVESYATSEVTAGYPYCWGHGIDDGTPLPANTNSTVTCSKSSSTTKPVNGNPQTVIFDSKQPVLVSGTTITAMDGSGYITGHGSDSKAYYWGMYGYRQDDVYTNIKKCVYTCAGVRVGSVPIQLAAVRTFNGTRAGFGANGGVASSGGGNSYSLRVAPPTSGSASSYGSAGGGCSVVTHYGYTKASTYTNVGRNRATLPTATSITTTVEQLSGNVLDGLYCAVITAGLYCDGNGTTTKAGQLGNGSSTQQTAGPHAVVSSGWLAGKTVTQLSTGASGYTCALASGEVGCWGENGGGQLGVGDTKDRNVPVWVGL